MVLISPYEPKYNADETGFLFWHYQQNHSRLREKSIRGSEMSKERLKCYCVGIWWEKTVLIGKAVKPRCFKNLKINNLLVM
jgi:hypothetical protein